jgi:hypothetical protein
MRSAQTGQAAERQQQRHWAENDEIGELGKHHLPDRIEQADQERAQCRADQAAAPADDDDREREHQNLSVGARIERQKRSADHAAKSGQRRAQHEGAEKDAADVDPHRLDHFRIVDAGADQRAETGLVQQQPEGHEHQDAERQHEDAILRIHYGADPHRAAERLRDRHRKRVAAPDHEAEIVEHKGDAERQQHLPQFDTANERQQAAIQQPTEYRNRRHRGQDAEQKTAAGLRRGIADEAADQIERAMREINDAQQPEDQGETGRHDEQQRGKGEAIENLKQVDARHGDAAIVKACGRCARYQSKICSPVQNRTSS